MLQLNLHREFFDAIAEKRKSVEYRAQSPFWRKRIEGKKYDLIKFRNGYSRAAQIVSAKEIGRSIGFVTCAPEWSEIVFLASQMVLYDFFGNTVGMLDIDLRFGADSSDSGVPHSLRVKTMKRFFIAEERAARRCRNREGKANAL